MKQTISALISAILLFALPFGLLAASPDPGMQGMQHGSQGMEHGGMVMGGNMIMLEEKTEDGVRGMVHLTVIGDAMAKMGRKENMHFMVMFTDVAAGAMIAEGSAALKVTDPTGKESEAMALVLMDGMFGADLALVEKGKYLFTVGTKLPDGKKRQFVFDYMFK